MTCFHSSIKILTMYCITNRTVQLCIGKVFFLSQKYYCVKTSDSPFSTGRATQKRCDWLTAKIKHFTYSEDDNCKATFVWKTNHTYKWSRCSPCRREWCSWVLRNRLQQSLTVMYISILCSARVANTTLLTGARADHSAHPGPSARQVVDVPRGKQCHAAGLFNHQMRELSFIPKQSIWLELLICPLQGCSK